MIYTQQQQYPFQFLISFHVLVDQLKEIAASDVVYRSQYAKALLDEVAKHPELISGMTSMEQVQKHETLIRYLLADLFPTALTKNEIKAVAIPFHNIIFNYTDRFQQIIDDAGPDFNILLSGYEIDYFYIMNCCLILQYYYKVKVDFSQPVFYDIPNKERIIEHYRVMYNGDFIEILPTENSIQLNEEDFKILLNNFENVAIWKEKFPPNSWLMKGFGIMSLFNATTEIAISNLKTGLIQRRLDDDSLAEKFESIFRSIFKVSDLQVGYSAINKEHTQFVRPPFIRKINSFLLDFCPNHQTDQLFCDPEFEDFLKHKKYIAIPDLEQRLQEKKDCVLAQNFLSKGIKSVLLAPLYSGSQLLGLIEIVSFSKNKFNSINAHKLDAIIPYLAESLERVYYDLNIEMEAIIQKEYTAIHPSVYWKFKEEAQRHIGVSKSEDIPFKEIVFQDVIPLYGQIDIKGSSDARNQAVQQDLMDQLQRLIDLYKILYDEIKLPVIYQNLYELETMLDQVRNDLHTDTESLVMGFIFNEVHPALDHFAKANQRVKKHIEFYRNSLDEKLQMVYIARKKYDETIATINKNMAAILDEKQEQAQQFFPHYYERFKTDGVEHNMYIGASIAPNLKYNPVYLSNLKLWQLQTACELEHAYAKLKPTLAYDLDVATLILVFSTPISIRFRMDEKRFDVDGTYNARYEVIKKRIDKSFIKGTNQRITQEGKITIVFSNAKEETEYRKYIHLLHHENLVENEVEVLEVEDLQGVVGLKALRVAVKFPTK